MIPRRGEVWIVDLGLAQKTRPALNSERRLFGRRTRADHSHFAHDETPRIEIRAAGIGAFFKPGAFVVQSVTTIPAKLALRRLGTISDEQLRMIEDGVRRWLAL